MVSRRCFSVYIVLPCSSKIMNFNCLLRFGPVTALWARCHHGGNGQSQENSVFTGKFDCSKSRWLRIDSAEGSHETRLLPSPAFAYPSLTFYKSYLTRLTIGLKHASYCLPQTLVIKGRDSRDQIEEGEQEARVSCGFVNNSSASPNQSSLVASFFNSCSLSSQPWSKETEPLICP